MVDDADLTPLKILVERAVRPVRAGAGRKRKMREELLAHVSGVFTEESKSLDHTAALTRTRQRFGDVANLTNQLQESVQLRDRVAALVEDFVGYVPRESIVRCAARFAAVAGTASLIALLVLMPFQGNWAQWLTVARVPTLLAPLFMAMIVFCGAVLAHWMRRALFAEPNRHWPRVILVGVTTWLLLPASIIAFCTALTLDFSATLLDASPLLFSSLLAPAVLVFFVLMAEPEFRYEDEWASLDLEASRG